MGYIMKEIEPDLDPNCTSLVSYNLLRNCLIMADYIVENGKDMPVDLGYSLSRIALKAAPAKITWLSELTPEDKERLNPALEAGKKARRVNEKLPVYFDLKHRYNIAEAIKEDAAELQKIYSAFIQIVEPATPHSIEYTTPTKKLFVKWGPPTIPLMVNFWVGCMICLFGFILSQIPISGWLKFLAPLDMFGKPLNLAFSAGLGAFFYSLYNANKYIINRTFDPKYIPYYLNRIIIGIIAGFILANILAPSSMSSGVINWNVSTLAILGGFSAEAVMKIMTRIVAMLITLVEGDSKNIIENKAAEQKAQLTQKMTKQKVEMAEELGKMVYGLKGKTDESIISELNKMITKILS